MSRSWSELSFCFESSSVSHPTEPDLYGMVRVTLNTYVTGTYDEPSLEIDGDLCLELLDGIGGSPARDLTLEDFSPEERRLIENRVDKLISEAIDEHAGEIAQEVYENAASAAYDRLKDRMKYGED